VPLVLLAFWIGLYPGPLFRYLDKPVQQIVMQVNPDYYKHTATTASAPPAKPASPAATAPARMIVPDNSTAVAAAPVH
jgi:hypothetical protein